MPHPTTLMKLARRFGPEIVEELNRALLERAVKDKLLRGRRLRIDTTAIEADVRHPTGPGLCAHAVSRLGRAVRAVKAAGLAARTAFRDRRRSAGRAIRKVSGALARGGNSRPAVDRMTARLYGLLTRTAREAERVVRNAARALRASGRRGAPRWPRLQLEGAGRIIAQTATRLQGQRTIPDRLISLGDRDARPIRRGKPHKPTEFGYQAALPTAPKGFVVSHQVHAGNLADANTLDSRRLWPAPRPWGYR